MQSKINNDHLLIYQIEITKCSFDILILIIGIISSILGVIQGIPWLLGKRPKSRGTPLYAYIDCERNTLIEEKEYEFTWGWIFFLKKIFLQNTSEDALSKLLYKPTIGPKKVLAEDCYMIERADGKYRIMLIKSDFFEEKEVERVYVLTKTPVDESVYNNNIEVRYGPSSITIVNNNEIEIRNYLVELPPDVTLDEISRYLGIISGLIVPELDDETSHPIKIRIRKLNGKQGDEPYTMIIPLNV